MFNDIQIKKRKGRVMMHQAAVTKLVIRNNIVTSVISNCKYFTILNSLQLSTLCFKFCNQFTNLSNI